MSDQIPEGVDLDSIDAPGVYIGQVPGDAKLLAPVLAQWTTHDLHGYRYGTYTSQGLTTHWMRKLPDGKWMKWWTNPHPNGPRP